MLTNYELLSDARDFLREQLSGIVPASELAQSWDEFFNIYDAIIRRFAMAGGVPPRDVDECVQEVWTAVVAHLENFHPDRSRARFRTWLFQIVRSKATDLIRKKQRSATLSLNDSRFELDVPDRSRTTSDELEECWRKESLRVLLADLKRQVTPTSYRLFELRAVRGKSIDELSRAFRMNPSAVRTRYHRTLKTFRSLQQRYTDWED